MLKLSDIQSWEYVDEPVVYDLSIEDNHNYYLEDDVLVHNFSKTFSTMQLLTVIATHHLKPILISIVSESVPHSKRGVQRDLKSIMAEDFNEKCWNKTDSIYKFGNNTMEFFSADDSSKLRGGRRDILYINEANNVSKMAFDELDVRTRMVTFIDFNPVAEFWAHELKHDKHVAWIHSTFLDALQFLPESVVQNIMSRKERDPNWWRVYGLGLVGRIEGLVHPEFTICKVLPEAGKETFGLDFGYSQDPCTLVQNKIINDKLYSNELFYEKGMTNTRIVKKFEQLGIKKGFDVIIADCADPKSIEEIHEYGYDIRPCVKGKDSITHGIQRINQYKQFWTEESLNAIKEMRNYQWEQDKDGKFTDKPVDDWNHLMDARRYSVGTAPTAKVLPNYLSQGTNSHFRKFDLKWSTHMVPKHTCIHYGAMSLAEDMSLSVMGTIWDNISGLLFIYWEHLEITPIAKKIVTLCNNCMHLDSFYFEKFLANNNMVEKDKKGLAKVFNAQFIKTVTNQNIKLREPRRYEEFGSIAVLNDLINNKHLYVHTDCRDTNQELSNWIVGDKGKLQVSGQRENLLMIISELRRDPRFEKKIKMPAYAPDYRSAPELGQVNKGL